MSLTKETKAKLLHFLHRRIKPGETFLLARLIADRIPAACGAVDKPWEQTLLYRKQVDAIIFGLNEYMHIPQCDRDDLYKAIDRVWLWRHQVASGVSNLIFRGSVDHMVDDFTGLMRCVDSAQVCHLTDIAMDANYMYDLLRLVVSEQWEVA